METIKFYIREEKNGFLSNFWRCEQVAYGFIYPTNEHYYQSEKAVDPLMKEWIRQAPTAWAAMMAGRNLREKGIVPGWYEGRRLETMLEGLRAKFMDPELRELLINTDDAILGEDSPTDMFWGIRGENYLGKLLMKVRQEISTPGAVESSA